MHRFLDVPLLLHPKVTVDLLERFRLRMLDPASFELDEAIPNARRMDDNQAAVRASYKMINNVAVIPVGGILVHGDPDFYDQISYAWLLELLRDAMGRNDARAVALQIASPGGEVSGLFEFADAVFESRGTKPIWSIVDDHAYSAAYAIASATEKIIVPRTGGVGSIGVVTMHLDLSGMMSNMGAKATFVQFGARKTDYSPFKPLSDEARDRMQADVDAVGEMFVDMVCRNRGLSQDKVRQTEAGVFMGKAGIEANLADAVMSPRAAFNELVGLIR
jgi:capsid assembly protease